MEFNGNYTHCSKCGKCCSTCKIVRDNLMNELATELILTANACDSVDEFISALHKRIDIATERNVRRIKNGSSFML